MKRLFQNILKMSLVMLISGCAVSTQNYSSKNVNPNIERVSNIKTISSSDSMALEWSLPKTNISGYEIYRSKLNEEMQKIATINEPLTTHFVDKKLEPDTTYRYGIKIIKDGFVSNMSNIVSSKTTTIAPVSFATIIKYDDANKIVWRPHHDLRVVNYVIEKSFDGSNWFKLATVKHRLSAEFIDKSSINNAQYRIYVVSNDSQYSKAILVKPFVAKEFTQKTQPASNNGEMSIVVMDGKAIVLWPEVRGVEQFIVKKSSLNGQEEFKVDKNSFEDGNITTGINYEYSILSQDGKTLFDPKIISVRN